jgi:hypothetical protein
MGFDDLQQRINAQSQQAAAHQEKLKVSIYVSCGISTG